MLYMLGILGDTRKQADEAYFMYVEDASADARSKDPTCVTSVIEYSGISRRWIKSVTIYPKWPWPLLRIDAGF